MSSEWPGVATPRTRRPPHSHSPGSATTSIPYRARSSCSCTTWSWWECVRRITAGVAPQRLDRRHERRHVGARVDEKRPSPPSRSAITNEFESQSGCMLRSISTAVT